MIVKEGILITIPAMITQAVSVYFALHALGINISFVLSTQVFYTALITGGLGVTEASMAALLLKYYSSNFALSAGAVIFVRLVTLWYPTVLGIIIGQFVLKYRNTPSGLGSRQ